LLCLDVPKAEALRHGRLALEAAEAAAVRAKALADPTRLMLAVALRDADGELCVCDLSWVAERSRSWSLTMCACCALRGWCGRGATARW
jgi:hypothetical protein